MLFVFYIYIYRYFCYGRAVLPLRATLIVRISLPPLQFLPHDHIIRKKTAEKRGLASIILKYIGTFPIETLYINTNSQYIMYIYTRIYRSKNIKPNKERPSVWTHTKNRLHQAPSTKRFSSVLSLPPALHHQPPTSHPSQKKKPATRSRCAL